MLVCRRILAGLTFLIGLTMLLANLAGGVGVWIVKERLTAKATRVADRVDGMLDVADQNLAQVKSSLARAADRLDSARAEQRKLAQQPQRNQPLRRMLARSVQQTMAPELGNANEKLHTVAEAAVVVNAVLEDVGNFPLLSVAGLDLDQLTEMNSRLADLGPAAWELSRLLGDSQSDADAASTQVSRIERALRMVQGWIAEFEAQLKAVRQRTEDVRSKALRWITPAAVLISTVCFWIALSQLSLTAHAWSWWKRPGPR